MNPLLLGVLVFGGLGLAAYLRKKAQWNAAGVGGPAGRGPGGASSCLISHGQTLEPYISSRYPNVADIYPDGRATVYAVEEGSIRMTRTHAQYGKCLVLQLSRGGYAMYTGLTSWIVAPGQSVAAGEPIGTVVGESAASSIPRGEPLRFSIHSTMPSPGAAPSASALRWLENSQIAVACWEPGATSK